MHPFLSPRLAVFIAIGQRDDLGHVRATGPLVGAAPV